MACRYLEKPGQVQRWKRFILKYILCVFSIFVLFGVLIFFLISASTKRSHEWASSGGAGGVSGEYIHRQTSTSPVRPSVPTVMATPAPASPSSSNVSVRKKMVSSVSVAGYYLL